MAKTYAGIAGAVLLLLGIGGLLLGDELLLGWVNIDLLEDLVHVASGIVLLVAASRGLGVARAVVGVVGVVYLLVGVLGFVAPYLLGLLPHGYTAVDNLVHVLLGLLALLAYANSRLPEPERRAADPRA